MLQPIYKFLIDRPFYSALVLFFGAFLLASTLINHELKRICVDNKNDARIKLLTLGAKLEGQINSQLLVLHGLKAEISVRENITSSVFEGLAKEYLATGVSIKHLALARDLIVTDIYPLAGNEAALGLNYLERPDQLISIQTAIDNDAIVLAGPIDLVQGGRALIIRIPVFIGEAEKRLWGIVSGVVDSDALFTKAGLKPVLWGLEVGLKRAGGFGAKDEVFYGMPSAFDNDPVSVNVQLPTGNWLLAAGSPMGWQPSFAQRLIYWFIGALCSLSVALATYLILLNYREKLLAIETANYRANYDVLTGLSNRYHFGQSLKETIAEHQRSQQQFALFFIDMDFFKEVNDDHGHHAGDELLRLFSARIVACTRGSDIVARLAGDEFVVVVKHIDNATQAEVIAEKLQQCLCEPYRVLDHQVSVTHSLGISLYPNDGTTMDTLLQNADRAMYEAKRAGKNRIFFFNDDLMLEVKQHVKLHSEILEGIRSGQFELYLQPIMNIQKGVLCKCEALVRWNHRDRGMISPLEFIPVAEQTGAIRPLGEWVLREACRLIKQLEARGIDIQVSINRSVAEFHASQADENWLNVLAEHRVDTHKVIFEITESLLMDGADNQLNKIHNLRNLGVAFSIDDFGTGYSAINYLRNYPVDFLKIDKSFIQDLLQDEQDRTLVEVIIKMGQTLGIQVVAEGVENQAQFRQLKRLGCDYVQGFYLGRPMPFEAFVKFYEQVKLPS